MKLVILRVPDRADLIWVPAPVRAACEPQQKNKKTNGELALCVLEREEGCGNSFAVFFWMAIFMP